MKKKEKIQEIKKRADEYAKTGEHRGWLSIESQIRSEGFPDAKRVLDNRFIRDELDSLCKTATSPEETERRKRFESWLEEIVRAVSPVLKQDAPDVSLSVRDKTLFITGPNYIVEVRRRFASSELKATKVVDTKDGQRYRVPSLDRITDFNFDEVVGEHAVKLVLELARSGSSTVKNF